MRVLIACEFSGVVRDAFLARGHDALSCDLLPTERPGPHYQGDVRDILGDGWDLMIAHPPCTYLTTTGNKWFLPEFKERFPEREKQRADAVEFFLILAHASIPKIAIENPKSVMSGIWRKADQIIQPYYFGHAEAKETALWLKGLPRLRYGRAIQMALGEVVAPSHSEAIVPEYTTFKSGRRMPTWYSTLSPGPERTRIRSRTFPGIAKAMAEQWGGICK